ncbi:MAG: transcription termination/antitermination protein NusG [Aminobacterium sp.]|uniref:transcription termination/antitermination protein NusG n=1 Tax=unclassified Aminobacterium TaxID=2685012 RepID=UPI001BCBBA31|nr:MULTISPECIES: transcription termination/antitermination protein NusG [unclassified Aminobacterium]MDD2207710.1 transcription termination/antitermination protein NusG [Aminobacterium sp.]MDD3427096.1 transcription termination/antitermination protein NusG [Aminobacterium sp.]MDD3708572.1 transcription termination/antitermination protein NusG [Aminobacterium sp.]MDD4229744.1 transcription termination/antitermination protein NusG [Aminobacterium sp.]MDD4552536.1 transcription termination/antite
MESSSERRWYIVQTYAGYENRVKANLEQRIATMGMEDEIFSVLVPVEERVFVKDGKSKKVTRKLYPSYVLVEMRLNDQSWYVVRHTPGVTGFVGAGNHPIPLSEKEVKEIMNKIGKDQSKPKIEMNLKPGDIVKVKSGPFEGQVGPVVEIVPEKGKVKFTVTVFGRETIVETDYMELDKL